MNKKIISLGIVSLLLLVGASTVSSLNIDKINPNDIDGNIGVCANYEEHPPIKIYSNEDFEDTEKSGVRSGTGTKHNPYIISEWNVREIYVEGTDAHFEINSCVIGNDGIEFRELKNGDIIDCNFYDFIWQGETYGIFIKESSDCIISSCTITNIDSYDSIKIMYCNNILIDTCHLENDWGNSLSIWGCTYSTIRDCVIDGRLSDGYFATGIKLNYGNNNFIWNCEISNCYEGFEISDTNDNVIKDCTVANCKTAIFYGTHDRTRFNMIYNNNIFGNEEIIGTLHDWQATLANSWDHSEIGNYWDNYEGFDNNGDGIGETPYRIISINNWDNYPQMTAIGIESTEPNTPDAPEGTVEGEKNNAYKYITITNDPEGDKVRYCFDWGDGKKEWTGYYESGEEVEVEHTWGKDGDYEVRVLSRDIYGHESRWSEPLSVTMPRSRFSHPLLNNILVKILDQFPLLQQIFKL